MYTGKGVARHFAIAIREDKNRNKTVFAGMFYSATMDIYIQLKFQRTFTILTEKK